MQSSHNLPSDLLNCSRSNLACCNQWQESKWVWMVLFRAALLKDVPVPWHGNHPGWLCQPFIPCQFESTLLLGAVLSSPEWNAGNEVFFTLFWLWKCTCSMGKQRNSIWCMFSKVLDENTSQHFKRKISPPSVNCWLLFPLLFPLNPWEQKPGFQMLFHVSDFSCDERRLGEEWKGSDGWFSSLKRKPEKRAWESFLHHLPPQL